MRFVGFGTDGNGDPVRADKLPVDGSTWKPYITLSDSLDSYKKVSVGSTATFDGACAALKGAPGTAVNAPVFLSITNPPTAPSVKSAT